MSVGNCSIKEITERIRTVINSKQEHLTDKEILTLIEDYVLRDQRIENYSFRKKVKLSQGI